MIRVALKASRLRMLRPRRVTNLAILDPWHQHITRFRARRSLRVATRASKAAMRIVIELRMRQPPYRNLRRGNFWERRLCCV